MGRTSYARLPRKPQLSRLNTCQQLRVATCTLSGTLRRHELVPAVQALLRDHRRTENKTTEDEERSLYELRGEGDGYGFGDYGEGEKDGSGFGGGDYGRRPKR